MSNVFELARGTDRDFPLTIVDRRTGLPWPFDGTETLTAAVWAGDDLAPISTPAAVLDGSAPTADILIRFLAADTSASEAGDYLFQAWATKAGAKRPLLGDDPAILRILPTPGTATARKAWISADDLRGYHSEADQFLNANVDQSGWREERADETESLIRRIVDRYMARPGFARRRGSTFDPVHGYDAQDYATPPPTKAELRAALDADGLTVDVTAREILARGALARILGGEVTDDARTNPYAALAASNRAAADRLFASWQAEVDFGDYDAIIDRDVTFLS